MCAKLQRQQLLTLIISTLMCSYSNELITIDGQSTQSSNYSLVVQALLDRGRVWIAVGEMLWRCFARRKVRFDDFAGILDAAARVQKQCQLLVGDVGRRNADGCFAQQFQIRQRYVLALDGLVQIVAKLVRCRHIRWCLWVGRVGITGNMIYYFIYYTHVSVYKYQCECV